MAHNCQGYTRSAYTPEQRAYRNLNPHKPAVAAEFLYSKEFAAQQGGSMDFWDSLDESAKRVCRDLAHAIERAWPEGKSPAVALGEPKP